MNLWGAILDRDRARWQNPAFMNVDLGIWANVATAIFTAVTAIAAWRAASVAKSAAKDASKISGAQTDALMTAAKANALASRINFYTQQMQRLPPLTGQATGKLDQLQREQEHLAHWLDQQTDALGVGLNSECPGSDEYNAIIRAGNKPMV
jgi:hypothetical protein